MRGVKPNAELLWLYQDSAAEVGFSAASFDGTYIQRSSPPEHPTERQTNAAGRQRRVMRALSELSPRHQAAIDCAYYLRNIASEPGGPKLISDYGVAAAVVRRTLMARCEAEPIAKLAVDDAGRARAEAARSGGQLDVTAAKGAETEAKRRWHAEQAITEAAATKAVQLLVDAHAAFEGVWAQHVANAKGELNEAKQAGMARREALLSKLLGLSWQEQRRADAKAFLEMMGIEPCE